MIRGAGMQDNNIEGPTLSSTTMQGHMTMTWKETSPHGLDTRLLDLHPNKINPFKLIYIEDIVANGAVFVIYT